MESYDDAWVDRHVEETAELWRSCVSGLHQIAHGYGSGEQEEHERAYDEALEAVERDLQSEPETAIEQIELQKRIIAASGLFAARALELDEEAIDLLTEEFLPVGTGLAHWARRFDPALGIPDIIQAARNAWTACGLQPLLGAPIELTPSILGYSLMYPYSDNYLDDENISPEAKLAFSRHFRSRLSGEEMPPANARERAIWRLVGLIESQYPRSVFPNVFECLLAIHQAQERSIRQLHKQQRPENDSEVLRLSCAKGGTSVLADACLTRGWLTEAESQFAFEWGVLLQLGDDLQDLRDDLRRGSVTMFSRAAAAGKELDEMALQLLRFSDRVGERMDRLPGGTRALKELLKMSWRSLIVRAIADSHQFFSREFLQEAENSSSFRFDFLRRRSGRLASREGLYAGIFNHFVPLAGECSTGTRTPTEN
jgi:hypothetical protein